MAGRSGGRDQTDSFHHRRAMTVGFLGLVLHLLACLALLIYNAYATSLGGGDHAAVTTAVYAFLGVFVWIALIILHDLHRRERREAVEAARMADDPAASAFESTGDELRSAAKRLAGFEKFGLPIIGLSLAAAFLIVGLVRVGQAGPRMEPGAFDGAPLRGWAIAIGLAMAFVGYVYARFVAGMAEQSVWRSLRAGAGHAAGMALLGLLIAAGHFTDMALSQDVVLRYTVPLAAVVLIVLGLEVILNFVLALYLPRRPGEEPRPIFDSRLLGGVASPDRIAENIGEALSYQFGVEVTQSWFFQLLKRWWPAFIGLAVMVVWSMTFLVVVEPHQRALILTNGKPVREVGPGLHFKWLWPIGTAYIPTVTATSADGTEITTRTAMGVRRLNLGTNRPEDSAEAILWTNDHTRVEIYNLVQPARDLRPVAESPGEATAGADLSLVAMELPVNYEVTGVEPFERFAAPAHRPKLIEVLGQRAATLTLGSTRVDQILGPERDTVTSLVRSRFEENLREAASKLGIQDQQGDPAGVRLLFVGSGSTHPPKDVAPNFEKVVQARQDFETQREAALRLQIVTLTQVAGGVERAERIVQRIEALPELKESGDADAVRDAELAIDRMLTEAGGSAGSLLIDARADRWTRHMGERAAATLYDGQMASYSAAPLVFRYERFLEAVRESMSQSRVYWIGDGFEDVEMVFPLQTQRTSSGVFEDQSDAAGAISPDGTVP